MSEWHSSRRFNLAAENGDRVCLCYEASTTGTIQQVVGAVTDYGNMTEFTEVTEDETDDVYRMCGVGLANRDPGEILRDGRKVGEFDSAWEVRQ